jgi:hypothetical protein
VRNFPIVSTPEKRNIPNAISATPRMLSVRLTAGVVFRGMIGVIAIAGFL